MLLDIADLDRLTRRLTRDYAELFGSEPRRPTTSLDADILDFSFLDGLGREEDLLRHRGHGRELRERREDGLEGIGLTLAESVNDAIRCPVHFHLELFDPLAAKTTFLFGLDSRLRNLAELEFPNLLAKSAELGAEARRLREASIGARETAALIRARVRKSREDRHPPAGR